MPYGVTPQEEAQAQRVVDESKRTAHVDTGALRRSIHYTVSRGQIIFRQLFYGQYNDNSQLIENAFRMMGDTPYTIEELDEEGNVIKQQRKVASGRITTSEDQRYNKKRSGRSLVGGAKDLIQKILAKREADGKKESGKGDNRKGTK